MKSKKDNLFIDESINKLIGQEWRKRR